MAIPISAQLTTYGNSGTLRSQRFHRITSRPALDNAKANRRPPFDDPDQTRLGNNAMMLVQSLQPAAECQRVNGKPPG
jgi:hypothetical protein